MRAESLRGSGGAVVEGPLLLTPQVFGDDRGFFLESWNGERWQELLAAGKRTLRFAPRNHRPRHRVGQARDA